MPSSRRRAIYALATCGVLATACGGDDDGSGDGSTVDVFAAASLTNAFEAIGEAFETANPGVEVVFNFAASSDLVTQIIEGAPADVFASADEANMSKLTDAGEHGSEPVIFATNVLEIAVERGNPAGIAGLESLEDDSLILAVCAPEVPCGRYATEMFATAGVQVTPDSLEENPRAVVAKVTTGEVDAGIVYRTDVLAAGDAAEGVEIPADINVIARYPIATTKEASNPDGARAFVDFVLSASGQAILAQYGFGAP